MKKGLTLIELIVVVALLGILAVVLAPRLRENMAKARDSKAIALLGALRTSSEVYYTSKESTAFGSIPTVVNKFNSIQDSDKAGLDLLIAELNEESKEMFDSVEYTVEIGGMRDTFDGKVTYGQDIGYTFHAPSGSTADGISLWFVERAIDTTDGRYDTKGKAWIEY